MVSCGRSGGSGSGSRDRYNRTRHQVRARHSKAAVADPAAVSQWGESSGPYLQQSMPGWRSDLSDCQQFCCLLVIVLLTGGLACAGTACWLDAQEVVLDYTDCAVVVAAAAAACNSSDCSGAAGECTLRLALDSRVEGPLYVYYAMSNAYFNHRRVQTSWSMRQLMGLPPAGDLTTSCRDRTRRAGVTVLPCGVLPEAIFNDTVRLLGPMENDTANADFTKEVSLSTSGITWPSHSKGLYRELKPEQLANTVPPASWPLPASKRYKRPFADADDLHTWLLTPAFSRFRKMSHRVLANGGGLPKGHYRVLIGYNYPVKIFRGVKSFILARKNLLGGKNIVLALLPALTCFCYLTMCVALLITCKCRAA